MAKKYAVPEFLSDRLDQTRYEKWLRRKAAAHVKGDKKRFNQTNTAEKHRDLLHEAVLKSMGKDYYTGEELHWERVSTYKNEDSKSGKSKYKSEFAFLPTLDHIHSADGTFEFAICGWRTNDTKNDLSLPELLNFCQTLLTNHGYKVEQPKKLDILECST